MKHLWGFGSFKIRNTNQNIQITNSTCEMKYTRVYIQQQNYSKIIKQPYIYYRPYFTIKFSLFNVDDINNMQRIITILNSQNTDNIYIYSNYNITNEDNTQFQVWLQSILVQDISDAVGQLVTLSFVGKHLQDSMIDYLSD